MWAIADSSQPTAHRYHRAVCLEEAWNEKDRLAVSSCYSKPIIDWIVQQIKQFDEIICTRAPETIEKFCTHALSLLETLSAGIVFIKSCPDMFRSRSVVRGIESRGRIIC